MYRVESALGAWYDPITSALKPVLGETKPQVEQVVQQIVTKTSEYAASNIVPTALDKLVPAALDYLDKNRATVWRQAKPVLERVSQDETIQREVRPVFSRILKREVRRYQAETFHPKYGRYGGPAVVAGASLLAGGLGLGYYALRKSKEDTPRQAAPALIAAYIAHLAGLALTVTGTVLLIGDRALQAKET